MKNSNLVLLMIPMFFVVAGIFDFFRSRKELTPEEEEAEILRELERTSILDYAKQQDIINRLRANKARQLAQNLSPEMPDNPQTEANSTSHTRTTRTSCGYCNGAGRYVCRACHGIGRNRAMPLTPNYTGNREVDALLSIQHQRDSVCSSCNGQREVTCPKCNGSGSQR